MDEVKGNSAPSALDKDRVGTAGMHDLIEHDNFNRDLKKAEVVQKFETVFIDKPDGFQPNKFRTVLLQGPHDEREGFALFPLGIGYVARIIHEMGVDVEVVDAHAKNLNFDQTLNELLNLDFDILGITALSTQYAFVKWVAVKIKEAKPHVKIIVGGQLAHYNPHTVIEHCNVDICVIGEGEVTIQDIYYNFSQLNTVDGIAFKGAHGECHRTKPRQRIKNPDVIPLPYYEAFDMKYYMSNGFYGARAKRAMTVLSSRGCPYSCTFCSLSFPNVTYRSVDNVIEEIKYLQEKFIAFADELFVIKKSRVREFCEKIKPLGISWGGQGRANTVDDDVDLLRTMKSAGASYIGYGLESSTSKMLTAMQKKTTVEQNVNCVKAAQEAGLVVVAQYMFGFPGESYESVKAGIDYFKRVNYVPPLGPDVPAHISVTTALPGSQLYVDCQLNGLIEDEDEYLSKISLGYNESKDIVVNLTDFSDDELLELKYFAEDKMMENYRVWMKSQGPFYNLKRNWIKAIEIFRFEGVKSLSFKLLRRFLIIAKSRISILKSRVRSQDGQDNYIFRQKRIERLNEIFGKLDT